MPPKRKASRGVARATASLSKRRRQDDTTAGPSASPSPQEDAPTATAMLATIMERLNAMEAENRATRAMVEEMKGGQTSGVAGGLAGGLSDSAPTASSSGGGETPNMAVTLAVGDAIASAASAVTGTFTSSVVPIDLYLSDKVKAQIWQDEYIDFSQLLPTNNLNGPMALGVQSQNGRNEVVMMPNRQKKTLSFQEWSSAWNIYSGIYLAKPNPQEGLCTALTKHFDVVQGLSRNNTGWQFYDHNFRLMVAKGLAQWGSVHAELLVEAKLLRTSPAPTGKRTSNNHILHGSCIRFHRTGHCRFQDDCKWSHTCVNCGGAHAAVSCGQRNRKHPRSFRGQSSSGSAGANKNKSSRNETNNTNNNNKS